jgi:hypothetical protein
MSAHRPTRLLTHRPFPGRLVALLPLLLAILAACGPGSGRGPGY